MQGNCSKPQPQYHHQDGATLCTLHLTSQQGLWCQYQQGQDIVPWGPDISVALGRR